MYKFINFLILMLMKKHLSGKVAITVCTLLLMLIPSSLRGADTKTEVTTIYGSQIYAESGTQWGIYSFPARPDTEFTPVWLSGDLMATGGAVYAGGKYYIISFLDWGFMVYGLFITCDVDNKEMSYIEIEDWNFSYITTDMAYDPASGKIYGCSMNADGSGTFSLSTMDVATGRQTPIAPIMQMCAMAADENGTLYGISQSDGVLYKIDKATAELTEVGSTGVKPSPNQQSATYDTSKGVMYWSAYTDNGGELYTVDTATGTATLVSVYPDKAEMIGIYVKNDETVQAQPKSPSGVEMTFERDALSGVAAFTMPGEDINGGPLSGDLTYQISSGENEIISGAASPSEQVEVPVEVAERGMYDFSFTVKNDAGAATAVKILRFVGMDDPSPVENIRISKAEDGTVELEWHEDSVGVHGGYVNTSKIVYNVIRQPSGRMTAEGIADSSFTDKFTPEEISVIYYDIIPMLDELSGKAASSGAITVGTHKTVPYTETFGNWTDYALYSVFDINQDEASWAYDFDLNCVRYLWAFDDINDDWLITPPVYLTAGRKYIMSANLRSEQDIYAGTVSMAFGDAPETEAMTRTILKGADIDKSEAQELISEPFSVDADGDYNLGLHVSGDRSIYYLFLDKLSVSETTDVGIQAAVGNDTESIMITRTDRGLKVTNASGISVKIYNGAGVCVAESDESSFTVSLPRGIYIVKTAGSSRKVAI